MATHPPSATTRRTIDSRGHRLGNVLEHVGQRDGVELSAELGQPLGAQSMHRHTVRAAA
jgi:hypothetical protein